MLKFNSKIKYVKWFSSLLLLKFSQVFPSLMKLIQPKNGSCVKHPWICWRSLKVFFYCSWMVIKHLVFNFCVWMSLKCCSTVVSFFIKLEKFDASLFFFFNPGNLILIPEYLEYLFALWTWKNNCFSWIIFYKSVIVHVLFSFFRDLSYRHVELCIEFKWNELFHFNHFLFDLLSFYLIVILLFFKVY